MKRHRQPSLGKPVLGWTFCLAMALVLAMPGSSAWAQFNGPNGPNGASGSNGPNGAKEKKDYPDFDKIVTDDFERLEGAEGSFIPLYYNEKRNKLFAGIPSNMIGKEFLLATSITGGPMRGFMWDDWLLKFEENDKKLLIIAPNTFETASGELKQVVTETYPDRLIATVPILTKKGAGEYIIDLKGLLSSSPFSSIYSYYRFGGGYYGGGSQVIKVDSAKVFPSNTEIELNFLSASSQSMHFSISKLEGSRDFEPRVADQRVGYFLTAQKDFNADERADTTFKRYINRWHLEKADKSLKLSPPKEPIIFYIEDTVPVKYRRWVREGIEMWNRAYEKIGIVGAIQVRQQTPNNEFAKLDPEDSRYNFFRWIASGQAFAMGPSRVNPRTGEILDADIIFDESMLRYWLSDFDLLIASLNVDSYSPQLRQHLAQNPHEHPLWNELKVALALEPPIAGTTESLAPETIFAREMLAFQSHDQSHNSCRIGSEMQMHMAFNRLATMNAQLVSQEVKEAEKAEKEAKADEKKDEEKADDEKADEKKDAEKKDSEKAKKSDDEKEKSDKKASEEDDEKADDDKSDDDDEKEEEEKPNLFEEWPEEFVGQMLRMVVAHEVGHTLGLRHNFKASSWKSFDEIVAAEDPNEPTIGSVMDYIMFSMNPDGELPQVWTAPVVGPYDEWAIEYGYAIPGTGDYDSNEKKMLDAIAGRSAEDGHDYLTDEDISGPDPRNNRWDLGKEPIEFALNQMEIANNIMPRLLEVTVKDGESYDKVRSAYLTLMGEYYRSAYLMARYVGGHSIHRDQKGTEDARPPIVVEEAKKQKLAFDTICDKVFSKDAFKIDPELQQYLAASRWYHTGSNDMYESLTYSGQDLVLRIQKLILFKLMNMDTMNNLYDSEYRVESDVDLFTLPELFQGLTDAIWSELDTPTTRTEFTVRDPYIDGLRRNLQRVYLSELIEATIRDENSYYPPITRTLAWKQLSDLEAKIARTLEANKDKLDAYTEAHLLESGSRITKALEADFTINAGGGGGLPFILMMGQPAGPNALEPGMGAIPNASPNAASGIPTPLSPYAPMPSLSPGAQEHRPSAHQSRNPF